MDASNCGPALKATRKQAINVQAAILAALRKRDGGTVVPGEIAEEAAR